MQAQTQRFEPKHRDMWGNGVNHRAMQKNNQTELKGNIRSYQMFPDKNTNNSKVLQLSELW